MSDTTVTTTQRQRVARAFETLTDQGITPILILTGSTGIIEENLDDYHQAAKAAGTPQSWVGSHPGSQEFGGTFWDEQGRLCFSRNPRRVPALHFSFPHEHPRLAEALMRALETAGFMPYWSNRPWDSVTLILTNLDGSAT